MLKPRKIPQQKRAEETVAAIVEGAARILEAPGITHFDTNAVAEKAGVSIGTLYQYFPDKDAPLSAVIERETASLLLLENQLLVAKEFAPSLRCCLQAAVQHQLRKPRLAKAIDAAERREMFDDQTQSTAKRLKAFVEKILCLPDAPTVLNRSDCADDLFALTRGLVDAASERGNIDPAQLLARLEGAVWGYLNGADSLDEE